MNDVEYRINYDMFEKLKAITLMTFEESKQAGDEAEGVKTSDYRHFMSMQSLESDVMFLKMVKSLFEHATFTLYELRREIINLWELGVLTETLGETKEGRKFFIVEMENAIKRCVELNTFEKVD